MRAERVFPRTSAGRTSFLSAHRRGILNIQSLNELTSRRLLLCQICLLAGRVND